MNTTLPIVGITLGDVAGIGPEVVAKALHCPDIYAVCQPVVIGDARVFEQARFAATLPAGLRRITHLAQAAAMPGLPLVLDFSNLALAAIEVGQVSAAAGQAAWDYVVKAVELAQAGEIAAIATAPLNKEALRLAGHTTIGHTEILAELTQTPRCTTMLATPGLRVTHVTRHVPFRDIAAHLSIAAVLDTILLTHAGMQGLGYAAPRLAVAGLNPHNGDNGLLGREEIEIIAPAVAEARARGITVDGPIPADSVFFQTLQGRYDVVVCQYHDQGHIAVKTHGFEQSITITLGLPLIRTSADHGTAFDIAGQGIANPASMIAAILEAARIVGYTDQGPSTQTLSE